MKAASSSVSLLGSESEKASETSSGMSCTVIPDLQNVQRLHCWADILAISLHMSPQRHILACFQPSVRRCSTLTQCNGMSIACHMLAVMLAFLQRKPE